MVTKKELIELAESNNIRFKKSWNKEKIQEAIDSEITNDSPIWIECKFSKIKFDCIELGVSERTEVHPEIAAWKKSANSNHWYTKFFEVIDYGVQEGYTTIEQFEKILERAEKGLPFLNFEPTEDIVYNFQLSGYNDKPWIAEITGLSEQYNYQRSFKYPVKIIGNPSGDQYFYQINQEGYYQTKEYLGSNKTCISWYKFEEGKFLELEEKDIIDVFGNPYTRKEIESQITKEFYNLKYHVGEGETFKSGEHYYTVLIVEYDDVDMDRISCDDPDSSGYFTTNSTYFCREATESEIETKLQADEEKKEFNKAVKFIKKLESDSNWLEPKESEIRLQGIKVYYKFVSLLSDTAPALYFDFENNLVWSIAYNGKDGDLWALNNYQGIFIVRFCNLPLEQIDEIKKAIDVIERDKPEAIEK